MTRYHLSLGKLSSLWLPEIHPLMFHCQGQALSLLTVAAVMGWVGVSSQPFSCCVTCTRQLESLSLSLLISNTLFLINKLHTLEQF